MLVLTPYWGGQALLAFSVDMHSVANIRSDDSIQTYRD